jgi:hypothetical protein
MLCVRECADEYDEYRMFIIDKEVEQGSHFVECMLLGEEGKTVDPFKILGIFST